jgi:hypothetical protein
MDSVDPVELTREFISSFNPRFRLSDHQIVLALPPSVLAVESYRNASHGSDLRFVRGKCRCARRVFKTLSLLPSDACVGGTKYECYLVDREKGQNGTEEERVNFSMGTSPSIPERAHKAI